MVDRRAFAAKLGFVEHIVMHQRGHVHHLDDGGDDRVRIAQISARSAGKEHQRRPKHLAAKPVDVLHQRVDAGNLALELADESLFNSLQFRLDAIDQTLKVSFHSFCSDDGAGL